MGKIIVTPLQEETVFKAKALLELGIHETGHNSGEWIDEFLKEVNEPSGESWCVAFATYCARHAAKALGTVSFIPTTASSSYLANWFKAANMLTKIPRPGYLGFLVGGPTGFEHTFIVIEVGPIHVTTIDGNWGNKITKTQHRIEDCRFAPVI